MNLESESARHGEPHALHAIVRGRVQAVGFRNFVLVRARSLGLRGYVRNGDDVRSVEVVAEGPVDALKSLLGYLNRGPGLARVDEVEASWSGQTEGFPDFDVRF
jgi:acylphosphatase